MADSIDMKRLVEQACQGDSAAFGRLADEHYASVYGVAFSTVGNWSGAQDLAQETFLLAWSRKETLKNAAAFPAWLRRIAGNLSKNWIRSADYRRRLSEHYASFVQSNSGPGETPTDQHERATRKADVWRALESLSPNVREAIVLYYLQGESMRSTAKALGISENAAKKRIHDGRVKLRAHFEEQWKREMAQARHAMGAGSARERFLAGLVVGPALPELGRWAAATGVGLWWEAAKQTATVPKALAGLGTITSKQAITAGATALLVAGSAYWTVAHRSGAHGEAGTKSETVQREVIGPNNMEVLARTASEAALSIPEPVGPPGPAELLPTIGNDAHTQDGVDSITLRGLVVDTNEVPVAGAGLSLIRLGIGTPAQTADIRLQQAGIDAYRQELEGRGRIWTGVSDHHGAFVINDVRVSGTTLLTARAPEYGAGMLYLYSQTLEASLGSLRIRLTPSVTVHGLLLGASGSPVGDAQMVVEGTITDAGSDSGGLFEGFATFTDSAGAFDLDIDAPGYVSLRVDSRSYGETTFSSVWVSPNEKLVLRYPAETTLFGAVRSATGSPVADAEVRLEGTTITSNPNDSGVVLGTQGKTFSSKTNINGAYRINNVDAGQQYSAEVFGADGESIAYIHRIEDLTPGAKNEVNFAIHAPMSVRGTVYSNQTGRPLDGIVIQALPETFFASSGSARPAVASSDVDGEFSVKIIGDGGTYALMTSYETSGGWGGQSPPEYITVHLQPGDTVAQDLRIDEAATRSFRLVDDQGNPVSGAALNLMIRTEFGGNGHRLGMGTETDGRVVVPAIPPYVSSELVFSKDLYLEASSQIITAEAGQRLPEETVVMHRPADLRACTERVA